VHWQMPHVCHAPGNLVAACRRLALSPRDRSWGEVSTSHGVPQLCQTECLRTNTTRSIEDGLDPPPPDLRDEAV